MSDKHLSLLVVFLMISCTAVTVQPVSDVGDIQLVCIVENPKVQVRDFVSTVEQRFSYHGIQTKLVRDPEDCTYTLDYTAERSWDLKPFLDYALLTLRKDGISVGSAEYRNRGGLTITKYAGTASKMNPVIDELLSSQK